MGEKDADYTTTLNEQSNQDIHTDAFTANETYYTTHMQVDPVITSPSQPLYPQIPPQILSDPVALTQFIQSLPSEQIEAIRTRILNPTLQDDVASAKRKLDSMSPERSEALRTPQTQHVQQTKVETNGLAEKLDNLSAEQLESVGAQIINSNSQANGVSLTSDQASVMLEKLKSLPPDQIQALQTKLLKSNRQSSSSSAAPVLPFISLPKKQTDLSQFVYISPPRSKLNGVDKAVPPPENKPLSQPNRPLSGWLSEFLNPRTKIDAISNMREIVKDLGEDKPTEQQVADRIFFVDAVTSGANAEFHRSILTSKSAMRLLKTWLLNSLKAKDAFATKIMKLLDILPWQVEDIKTIKELELGKLIRIAGKDESAKETSVSLQGKIRRLLEQESKAEEKQEEGPRKKVKLDNGTSAIGPSSTASVASTPAPASSKPAAAPLKVTVKPKGPLRTTLSALDNAASKPSTYNSFFDQIGASKAKPAPKKAAAAAAAPVASAKAAIPPPPPPAKSGSVLDSVIDSMTTSKKEKTPEAAPIKKRKRVTFKPDDDLVQIRYIDLVDRDGNPRSSHQSTGEARDLDVREGHHVRSLMGHTDAVGSLIEEVEWSIPADVDLPQDVSREIIERGNESTEKTTQEEREKHVVGAVYIFAAQIPDSPSEPKNMADANPYGEEGEPKMIILPQQLQQQQAQQPTAVDFAPLTNSLESLLRSLQPPPSQQPPPMPDLNSLLGLPQANAPAVDFNAIMGMLSNVQNQPMQAPMPMSMPMQSQMPPQPQPQLHTQTPKWNPAWTPRVTCKYWLEGKCRKGDQCTFKHTQ